MKKRSSSEELIEGARRLQQAGARETGGLSGFYCRIGSLLGVSADALPAVEGRYARTAWSEVSLPDMRVVRRLNNRQQSPDISFASGGLGEDGIIYFLKIPHQSDEIGGFTSDMIAMRDVDGYFVSDWTGLDVASPTVYNSTRINDILPPGVLQWWVPGSRPGELSNSRDLWYAQQKMAVFDYIIGNLARNDDTYVMSDYVGSKYLSIYHGLSFPPGRNWDSSTNPPIHSPFVDRWIGRVLQDTIVDRLRSKDPQELAQRLIERAPRVESRREVIWRMVDRLNEVRDSGKITGAAHKAHGIRT